MEEKMETPLYSRLFLLCQPGTSEMTLYDHFKKFGTITDISVVRDRRTSEDRGFAFITFAKMTEAVEAMNVMHGKVLPGTYKQLKIIIARQNPEETTNTQIDERLKHITVVVAKGFSQQRLKQEFEQYGEVKAAVIFEDDSSSENMGLICFGSILHAARAYENCERAFKPKFSVLNCTSSEVEQLESAGAAPTCVQSCSTLIIQAPLGVKESNLRRLFDLIPTMEYCNLNETIGIAIAKYSSAGWAAYAKDKLHKFEYPLGSTLSVQFADPAMKQEFPLTFKSLEVSPRESKETGTSSKEWVPYCSFSLPPVQPLVTSYTEENLETLLIFSLPSAICDDILKDVFCRFGDLVEIYKVAGCTCSYVKYASKLSARRAVRYLNGVTVAGQKLKVLLAEQPKTELVHEGMEGGEGPSKKAKAIDLQLMMPTLEKLRESVEQDKCLNHIIV